MCMCMHTIYTLNCMLDDKPFLKKIAFCGEFSNDNFSSGRNIIYYLYLINGIFNSYISTFIHFQKNLVTKNINYSYNS